MFKNLLVWIGGTLLLLQFIQIKIPPAPKSMPQDQVSAPKEVISILKKACYDCHSNQTVMPWYGDISPISIMVHSNIKNGRNWLNFSIFNRYDEKKKDKLYKGIVKSTAMKMPPAEYLLLHKDARLSPKERKVLQDWAKKLIKDDN